MKSYFLAFVLCAGCFLHGCGESVTNSQYVLGFPEIPSAWRALLGSPYWQVQWLNREGYMETATVRENAGIEVSLPQTLASAVIAMPFWPDREIRPGVFKPAGAIFPFDVSGERLALSWQGGVDANLFWEFVNAANKAGQESAQPETDSAERAAVSRMPWNFNWPRFRLLFSDPAFNADIRADPWLADWSGIAEKILLSGFDKRRLIPAARSGLEIPVGSGPWIGTSPFAAPLFFETVPVFPVGPEADTWVSREGILRCNKETWILRH